MFWPFFGLFVCCLDNKYILMVYFKVVLEKLAIFYEVQTLNLVISTFYERKLVNFGLFFIFEDFAF